MRGALAEATCPFKGWTRPRTVALLVRSHSARGRQQRLLKCFIGAATGETGGTKQKSRPWSSHRSFHLPHHALHSAAFTGREYALLDCRGDSIRPLQSRIRNLARQNAVGPRAPPESTAQIYGLTRKNKSGTLVRPSSVAVRPARYFKQGRSTCLQCFSASSFCCPFGLPEALLRKSFMTIATGSCRPFRAPAASSERSSSPFGSGIARHAERDHRQIDHRDRQQSDPRRRHQGGAEQADPGDRQQARRSPDP